MKQKAESTSFITDIRWPRTLALLLALMVLVLGLGARSAVALPEGTLSWETSPIKESDFAAAEIATAMPLQAAYKTGTAKIEVQIANNTSQNLTYGEEYHIERKTSAGWQRLQWPPELEWIDIGYEVASGAMGTKGYDVAGLGTGSYRIVLSVYTGGAPAQKALLAAAFALSETAPAVPEMTTGSVLKATRVYDRPSTKGKTLAKLKKGAAIHLLYFENGYAVVYNKNVIERVGYVPIDHVRADLPASHTEKWHGKGEPALYTLPNTAKKNRIGTLQQGQEFEILAREGKWWYLYTGGEYRYLQGKYYTFGTRSVLLCKNVE